MSPWISFRKRFGGFLGCVVDPGCVLRDLVGNWLPSASRQRFPARIPRCDSYPRRPPDALPVDVGVSATVDAVAPSMSLLLSRSGARPTFRHCQEAFEGTLRGVVGALGHVVEISTLALVSNNVVEMTTIREQTSPIC